MTITLLDGTSVDSTDIAITNQPGDPGYTWWFYTQISTGADLTWNIRQHDKIALTIPAYTTNVSQFQADLADQAATKAPATGHAITVVPGDTSTASNLLTQLGTDPLGAPVAALNKGVSELVGSSGFGTLAILGIAAVALMVVFNNSKK